MQATEIDAAKPLVGLTLKNITGTCSEGISRANVKGAVIRNVHVTEYSGKLINVENTTGTGLAGAGKLPEEKRPKPVEPISAPEVPYKLH